MTSKTIMIGLVAIAFVAGSIMTGTMAEAAKDKSEGNDNNPFKQLWDAIAGLQGAADNAQDAADNAQDAADNAQDAADDLQSQINVLELEIVTKFGSEVTASPGNNARSFVTCDAGYQAIGGGVAKIHNAYPYAAPTGVVFSQPSFEPNGWEVQVHQVQSGTTTVKASVQCALIGP